MNPFVYPALIVLCLCGTSTVPLVVGDKSGFESLILHPVWIVSACMLAAIALASQTGTGVGPALVGGLVLGLALAFAWYANLARGSPTRRRRRRR